MNTVTLVTALYDLKRNELSPGFSRDFSHYLECFKKLLETCHHIPMVIYCDDSRVKQCVAEVRDTKNTTIIHKKIETILPPPFIEKIDTIRKNEKWQNQSGWLKDSPQCALDDYNTLVMAKQFMLNDVSITNPFNSDRFFWIDAAIANTCQPSMIITDKALKGMTEDTKTNKMLYLAFPYDGKVEVHGFEKSAMNRYAGQETEYVCRGGFFGGTREAVNRINEVYYSTLNDTLNNGYMGTEESVFTIISYARPELVNVQFIEPNGLIYKYFEDLEKRETSNDSGTALYFLSYNFPKQLEYCLSSFKKAFPDFFELCDKHLINNSTDPKVTEKYNELIEEYSLTEHKFNNIGICGARQFTAEHFDSSDKEFMIFFEDDMIVNGIGDSSRVCKSGFSRFVSNVFPKAITIMNENSLDYLKLNFSEFYGDNHKNWAWYNMGEDAREKWLYRDGEKSAKNKINYTGVYRQLSYAVGEYHYCNWPLIFTKEGSRKVFLDPVFEHPYEQTWMSHVQRKLRSGDVKAGVLLASPITHHRKHHYPKKDRKEC